MENPSTAPWDLPKRWLPLRWPLVCWPLQRLPAWCPCRLHRWCVVPVGFGGICWQRLIYSKTFPTYPWNIPWKPWTKTLWRNSFHLEVWPMPGVYSRGMLGFSWIYKQPTPPKNYGFTVTKWWVFVVVVVVKRRPKIKTTWGFGHLIFSSDCMKLYVTV